jgi:plastocyanin
VRRHLAVLGVALVLAGAGCGSSSVPSSTGGGTKAATVTIKNIAYNPPTIQIHPGQTVTWKFADGPTPHTVTADDHSFDSGMMSSGQFSHRFDAAGTFTYTCTVHPQQMKGTVVVQ